ncbi:cadherin-related tumor suppressor [Condylostylus longicornis]|uniref:cadherin-related tumor suppressor n=1 Tax=Condylostylus longicornis TaxID=2530218 RepID=UPI00244DAC51|nr:cadherin-related tumor suppressor [Condylostylus longicornis]
MIDGDDGKFILEPDTGKLILRDALDRESKEIYKIKIRVTDGIQSSETIVNVQVTDTNDNPPTFSEAVYSFDVPENAVRGYQVGKIIATDRDLGDNAIITYSVISDWANDVFNLHPQTGVFTLTARLDYEEVQHYILVVQAQDNGHPSLSTTITVYCNTVDLNDNAPIFDPMSYSNEIFENVPIGTNVITVTATDIDSGFNGQIEYSIIAGDDKNDFDIDQNGTIRTKRTLDRETKNSYNMIIAAKDCPLEPQQRLSSTVQVTVIIKDINDESPVFISSNETSIIENTPLNTIVMALKAIDHDEGRNGYIEYQLVNPESNIPFSLGAVDGLLRVSGHLDRELKSKYIIDVRAKDRGEPPKSTQTQIIIKILDENDNSPVFDPKLYSASVAENASIGAMVLQVSATDIDEDANGRVRFMIASGDENRDFSISEDSGVIRVAKNLNYERKSRYVLTVRAEDCATEALENERYDTAELTIVITDINDNPPTFLDSPYLAKVMENIIPPNDGYVIKVKAFDADTPPFNNQVRYFLKEGDADLFRINSSTGEIYLQRSLDREMQSEYILTIVAMDTGSPPLTGTGIVKIIVQDMNDHSPEFERQSYYVTVRENSPINLKILQPLAIDKDSGLNAKLKYYLKGDKVDRFKINSNTGEITTAAVLDREEKSIYYLTLIAQDSSPIEQRSTSINITIKIDDVNDNSPQFSKKKFEINLPDRIKANEFVFGAEATDIDTGDNSKITYSISGRDANIFTINKLNGVIKTNIQLSSDTLGFNFNLMIHAEDQGIERKTATAELALLLQPANLFPRFSYISNIQFVLSEDVVEGHTITKVTATSPKTGSASNIKYSFAGGNVGNALNIDTNTGTVSVGSTGLDYEEMHQYEIWVQAADSDEPALRSVMLIIVNVTDTNDNPPIMEKMLYNTEVLEEETPPQFIIKIKASDKDSGVNSELTYRLIDDHEGIFEIDADTGEIYTTTKLDREDIAMYELDVEAVDQGMPQLIGKSTVIVKVLDKNDNPPRFTRLFSVNVTENAEIGSFVIKVTSSDLDVGINANVSYTFAQNPGNKFSIDSISGNVTVSGNLDREIQDEYILKVTASDGAWRADTPITITIQDQNDNAPEFEHNYYSFSFPELQTATSFVGQVIATDRDKQGPNSVISYSFKQPSDFFIIDPATGEIFTKRSIQFKHSQIKSSPENTYSLNVLATDNGKPPMYSECLVNLNVVDANNNQPKFTKNKYLSPVPENAKVGQKVSRVEATDDLDYGVNAEIDYMITGGNGSSWFSINKHDGWITVSRNIIAMDNTLYVINVRATDHGVPPKYDEISVELIVSGENLYTPQFTALSYQVIVPENEPINSTILTVSASDQDHGPNGIIRYSILSGNEKKEFSINSETGAVTISQALDYDTVQEYHLNITAKDLGFRPKEAIAMLTVILTDVNDNAPQFDAVEYHAYIEENKPRNSFVFKAKATDKDSPKNAVILYSITGGTGRDIFAIDSKTGVITSLVSFDYEEQKLYSLQIRAVNPDSPMSNSTKITVHIVGVNEYFPRFIQPVFHFDVSESSEIGSFVGTIQAVDKDAGDDGKVYYLLVGSSNDKGFSINPVSGKITVSRILDRETQSRVVLTVMAKNQGGIRGNDTDEAQVIITIQDGNDPPEFTQPEYTAKVSESVSIGTKIVQVKAIDKDIRPQNNQFSYSIINGNINQAFKIEPQTGEIETANQLDREKTDTYNLIIGAIDTGLPPQTGTAMVKVQVQDVNDNGPIFEPNNLIGYISENEPTGTSVMTLQASDPDLPPNGGPFTYYLTGGKHRSFVNVDKYTGLVRTLQSVDRETTPKLEFKIEVEDNGTPKMRSQHIVNVNVLDQNDNPSSPRSVTVMVMILNRNVPNTKIADIHPNDPDIVGDYKCRLNSNNGSPNFHNYFTIPSKCDLYSTSKINPDVSYTYSILGNDGLHGDVSSTVSIEFSSFDNGTIANSVTIRIENVTAESFLSMHYHNFIELIKSSLEYGDQLVLYNIRKLDNTTSFEVYIAVRAANLNYRPKSYVVERLNIKHDSLVKLLQLQPENVIIGYSPCSGKSSNTCSNNGVCTESMRYNDSPEMFYNIIDSKKLIFSAPPIAHDFICKCPEGFVGQQCEQKQDPCSPNPCQANAECRKQGREFQCICPVNREGRYCHLEKGDLCKQNPCKNGGSCQASPDGVSYFCLCRPGYRGNNCEYLTDSCRPNPCMHDGLCVNLKPGYKCNCVDGRYGRHCEKTTFGFQELSYMSFPSLDTGTNDISIIFATTKQDALLLYNYGQQSGGRSDFIALELVKGKATFSLGGSRTAITSVTIGDENRRSDWNKNLADGSWHKITATRNGKLISLSVSKCIENGDVCQECKPGDSQCYADDIGPTGTLNFNKQPLLVGGLITADPVLERPGQIHSDDLVGCVHSVSINGRTLNLSNPIQSRGILSTCNRKNSGGPCAQGLPDDPTQSVCGSFGTCIDRWNTALCRCGAHLLSPDCFNSLEPISLSDGGFLEFKISEKHRRMQLLDNLYHTNNIWSYDVEVAQRRRRFTIDNSNITALSQVYDPPKSMSLLFKTVRSNGLLLFAATNKYFTSVEIRNGKLFYNSKQTTAVNMTINNPETISDGKWHNVTLFVENRVLRILIDNSEVGEELDAAGVHDFLDPYLTMLSIGGVRREYINSESSMVQTFQGCLANFTINNEIQPFNGSGSVFFERLTRGSVFQGCLDIAGVDVAQVSDPLSIGITLVIVFFIILLVAILVSFVVFRVRKQQKEKCGGPGGGHVLQAKTSHGSTHITNGIMSSGVDCVITRNIHSGDVNVGYHVENNDIIRRGGEGHHLVGPELISKKFKERDINSGEHQRTQRPDIIEREVVSKNPPHRDEHHQPIPPPNQQLHPRDLQNGAVDLNSEYPEHYDLENASSIAPSDIDIVYHYKGYREGGGVRKYKTTTPPIASFAHHKHQSATQQQHRHSPHHAAPFVPRVPPQGNKSASSTPRQHQSTPLARLSPSSELSSQQPRILTLHDISGKPLQTALLATTSSSGGVGKDVLHSNSERSLNSPVMSQLSGQSSSASRKNPSVPTVNSQETMGLTADEIDRLNARPRTSSLVSTLDAVSSSSEAPRVPNAGHHLSLSVHHSTVDVDEHSSTSTDESGNDSFTCSEIEYDNNSLNGNKYNKKTTEDERRQINSTNGSNKTPIPQAPSSSYGGFDSSFRGSLSTLVASDDDISTHMGRIYNRKQNNGAPSSSATTLGWDYLLNWGPNYESIVGVFKAQLPDSVVDEHLATSLRSPPNNVTQKPSEEYV